MDELEQLRQAVYERKLAQNKRREKAGKPPMHKNLKPPKAALPSTVKTPKTSKTKPPMPESGNIDDSAMSFDEWKEFGFTVRKGSKADIFDMLGKPQFTLNQVQKTNPAWAAWRQRNPK